MPTLQILSPKKAGLVREMKPEAIVLSSSYDKAADCAVRYNLARNMVEELGYRVLNKRKICFTDPVDSLALKPLIKKNRQITLWLESHGSPAWLFGATAKDELEATFDFSQFAKSIEDRFKVRIRNIVLGCCYSATEYSDPSGGHFYSPARLLSLLVPNADVIGFVGRNASAKATHLWINSNGAYKDIHLSLVDASIQFQNGQIIEASRLPVYGEAKELSDYIRKKCTPSSSSPYFLIDYLDSLQPETARGYGAEQIDYIYALSTAKCNSGYKMNMN